MSALQNGSDMKTVRNRRISVSKVENPIRRKSTVKLRIKETAWAINRMAGGYRERVTADVCFPVKPGSFPILEKASGILPLMRLRKTVSVFRYTAPTQNTTNRGK